MTKFLTACTLLSLTCGTAFAITQCGDSGCAAPEISPMSAVSAITLLFGSLAVLTGRKQK